VSGNRLSAHDRPQLATECIQVNQGQPRSTRFVLAALGRDGTFVTTNELHRRIHDLGRPMGVSTVYRSLRVLRRLGLVDVVVDELGRRRYRRCSSRPHHHLVCSACHATVEIPATSAPLPDWVPEKALGFTDVVVRVTISGLCAECTRP
jgi:Fur family transcriptional regulator, ferric uptake regulator